MLNNKPLVVSIILICSLLIHNSVAAFSLFDSISTGLQSTVGSIGGDTEPADKPKTTYQKTASQPELTGFAKKNANVRSAPNKTGKKVGRLTKGTAVNIIKTQGSWFKIEAAGINGWVYSPLITISSAKTSYTSSTPSSPRSKNRNNVYYTGYSKEFQPVIRMMRSGNLNGVEKFFNKREAKIRKESKSDYDLIENIGLLRWMERGTLGLDINQLADSTAAFENAEAILKVRQENSQASDLFSSFTTFTAETLTGNEEFQEYPGEGYEKVLMLNYKSIAFLLDGKRKAYNTTRRAIDWQNMEKEKFADEIAAAKQKEKKEKSSKSAKNSDWQASYKKLDRIAETVPSAFVNPFGYYVAGMVQEFESKDDRSLRDNARIAYQKALDLNPQSKVLKRAVKDMKKKYDSSKRLVHIVVADGFVPEKKVLVYNIPTHRGVVPIKLSIYEPVHSEVGRIEVQTTSGKRLALLSSVADVEAICLRHQKDQEGFRTLRVSLAIARSVGVNEATSQLGFLGSILGSAVNNMAAPDMRSWMSLPATLQAARIKISNSISKVKIVSFDRKGRKLTSKTVKINKQSDNFIYARSIDKQLYVNGSKKLWL
ncbi:MAG: SH3 domain-containing protein [Pseudomonadota bacterium]